MKLWPRWSAHQVLSPRRYCCWQSMTPGTPSTCTSRPQSHSPVYRPPMALASTPAPSPCCWLTTMPLKTEGRILASGCWCITGSALVNSCALCCTAVHVAIALFPARTSLQYVAFLMQCMHLCACDSAREFSIKALTFPTICSLYHDYHSCLQLGCRRTATFHDNIFSHALIDSCVSVQFCDDVLVHDQMYSCASVRLLCC